MAEDERRRPDTLSERTVYEPRVALRRIRGALLLRPALLHKLPQGRYREGTLSEALDHSVSQDERDTARTL